MTEPTREMNEQEQLIQRFVDQELSAGERVRFVTRLGRDSALRERVIEMEELLLDTARLSRAVVPPAFVSGVLARLETPVVTPVPRPGILARLRAPRTLTWNLAGALTAACLVIVSAAVATRVLRPVPPVVSTAATPTPVLVRLLVIDPAATTVQVAGDFNGWDPGRTSLERVSGDAWAVTIALDPGRYEYMFVIDGTRWIADPFASETNDDGFGSKNAVLDVNVSRGAPL